MNKPLFPDVVVNGVTVSAAQMAAEAQNHPAPQGKPGQAWHSAARALVIRALLLQEATRQGLEAEPQEVARGKFETEDEALIRQVLELSVQPEAPTTEAVEKVYHSDPERFSAPSLYEPAHILFAADPNDPQARAKAETRARATLEILRKNPAQFALLAKEQSDCESRAAGGNLGQISSGDLVPEFEAALDSLAAGEIHSQPVESRYGFHVVRLDAKLPGQVLPFDTVRDQISETLEKIGWAEAAKEFVDRLVGDAKISGIKLG